VAHRGSARCLPGKIDGSLKIGKLTTVLETCPKRNGEHREDHCAAGSRWHGGQRLLAEVDGFVEIGQAAQSFEAGLQ
jgi:hypothetical protein